MTLGLTWRRTARRIKRLNETVLGISPDYSDRPTPDFLTLSPSCGNELSGAMEFCPVCMLRKGLAGGSESGRSSFGAAVKPTPERVGQQFGHYELVKGQPWGTESDGWRCNRGPLQS